MASVNKVILVGNLGNDPDIKTAQSGTVVANLSLATSEKWKYKQSGQMQDRTEWHRIVFFWESSGDCPAISSQRLKSLYRRAAPDGEMD